MLELVLAPSEERATAIGRLNAGGKSQEFVELLIDLEEDRQTALTIAEMPMDSLR